MKIAVVLHSDDAERYGLTVPDLAGCFSAGDSIEDALESVKEAIELHLEGLLEEGEDMPVVTSITQHQNNPDYSGGVWAVVDVDRSAFEGEAARAAMR